MGPIYTIGDIIDFLQRRALLIIAVTALGCVAAVFWALSVPHLYRSSEVIQIEQPKIADDLASSTVEGSAARRLQLIEQRLMARDSLISIIDEFSLYPELDAEPISTKVNILRSSVSITGVAAPQEGFGDDGAISVLTITAEMGDAQTARDVAHAFADRTRALSAARRKEQAEETLDFFRQQEQNLIDEIAALESEQTAYRQANNLSMDSTRELMQAELLSLNDALLELDREIIATQLARDSIDRTARRAVVEREEAELDNQLASLTTQRQLLRQRRATLSANLETTPEVERELARFERRLVQLQSQLNLATQTRRQAEVGFSLESDARGERLITLEAAEVPDYPFTMSRKRLAMLGGIASLLVALGIAFLLELRRPVIRTARQMERETGLRPVISVPNEAKRSGGGLSSVWQQRRKAGLDGRAARLAKGRG